MIFSSRSKKEPLIESDELFQLESIERRLRVIQSDLKEVAYLEGMNGMVTLSFERMAEILAKLSLFIEIQKEKY